PARADALLVGSDRAPAPRHVRVARRMKLPRTKATRLAIAVILAGLAGLFFWWRGSSLAAIGQAFTAVKWQWVAVAIALNLLSVVVRALAWTTVIRMAMPAPHPKPMLVFSAFSVGLFANALLPGRVGELARVGVLT